MTVMARDRLHAPAEMVIIETRDIVDLTNAAANQSVESASLTAV